MVILIRNRGKQPIAVDVATFENWCPGLPISRSVDAEAIAEQIRAHLSPRIRLSGQSIIRTLRSFLCTLKRGPWNLVNKAETRHRIQKMLVNMLGDDINKGYWNTGLYRSRHSFVALCYIAWLADSERLADELCHFLFDNMYDITGSEDPPQLQSEWAHGIRKIRYLIDANAFTNIMYQLGLNNPWDYDRGRRPIRPIPNFRPRAITAPLLRSRYRSPPRLALAPPGFYSDFPGSVLDPGVEELRDRQELLEVQVQELQNEVAIGTPPMYSPGLPPLLTWHSAF